MNEYFVFYFNQLVSQKHLGVNWPNISKQGFINHWLQLVDPPSWLFVWTCKDIFALPPFFAAKLLVYLRYRSPALVTWKILYYIPSISSWSALCWPLSTSFILFESPSLSCSLVPCEWAGSSSGGWSFLPSSIWLSKRDCLAYAGNLLFNIYKPVVPIIVFY